MSIAREFKNPEGSLMARPATVVAVLLLGASAAQAQRVDLGGTGGAGPINITVDTELPLPPDGIIHATTITVHAGATLTFTRNERNTGVMLIATGDVVIDGTISVDGKNGATGVGGEGGPGGTDGGLPASWTAPWISAEDRSSSAWCSGYHTCFPIVGYSGGKGSYRDQTWMTTPGSCTLGGGGGGGAGALWITSHTRITGTGLVSAMGGQGGTQKTICGTSYQLAATAGANGKVFLVAPRLDWTALNVAAGYLDAFALEAAGEPIRTPSGNVYNHSTSLVAWRAPLQVTARLVELNGSPMPPGETASLTTTATTFTVVIEGSGCTGRRLELGIAVRNANKAWSTLGNPATVNNPVAAQTYQETLILSSPSSGSTYSLRAFASCVE